MALFEPALKLLQPIEGGEESPSAVAKDPGGATCYGISQRFLDSTTYVNPFGRNTTRVEDLTKQDAAIIFDKHFWEPYPFSDITSQDVANVIFIAIVNMSPKKCIELVQQAINTLKRGLVAVDGVFGNVTVAAINSCESDWLVNSIKNCLREYYLSLPAGLNSFKNGWLNRVSAS
jgi:lysozyme family protein